MGGWEAHSGQLSLHQISLAPAPGSHEHVSGPVHAAPDPDPHNTIHPPPQIGSTSCPDTHLTPTPVGTSNLTAPCLEFKTKTGSTSPVTLTLTLTSALIHTQPCGD